MTARWVEDKPGRIWVLQTDDLRVAVHRFLGCEGWYLSCQQLGIHTMQLNNQTLDGAREEALVLLKLLVSGYANQLKEIC
jgi:hypothetical protein